jgi:tetratricopeptide (TPR) repeat protein
MSIHDPSAGAPAGEPVPVTGRQAGEPDAARTLTELEAAERKAPADPAIQQALSSAYASSGESLKAAAARIAALALAERAPLALYNLATAYMMKGQLIEAEKWYRVTLLLDPDLPVAHQNLASILRENGDAAGAAEHLKRAYTKQAVFVEAAGAPVARVLLACAAGIGNVPVTHLLPPERFTQVRCFVEYVSDADLRALPDYDLVFNAIGDPDIVPDDDARLHAVLGHQDRPLLNRPDRVAANRRDRLPSLLAGIDGIVVPAVQRIELRQGGTHALADEIEAGGLPYPLVLRPSASHGGEGVLLAAGRNDVEASALGSADAAYATAFHEYRAADGYFRKYRMIFVDREPFAYHLAISKHWLVHYFSADMLEAPWKRDEERRFLEDPATALGTSALAAVRAIGRRLDLDYGGIDFSLLPDGKVLVFEANATMLVHPEPEGSELAHKNVQVRAIVAAFERMLVARLPRARHSGA